MMNTASISNLTSAFVVFACVLLASCNTNSQSPGFEYMPDMYRTPALEPYSGNSNYGDSMEARLPAPGTIPRGFLPYGLPNTPEGYEMAGELLKNPFPQTEEVIGEGKVIYTKYCVHCHGTSGAGDGPTIAAGHPPPPAYSSAALANLVEGKMFHSITYGKNLMGSHSSQLNVEERWKVIRYVETLQKPNDNKTSGTEESPKEPESKNVSGKELDVTAMNN